MSKSIISIRSLSYYLGKLELYLNRSNHEQSEKTAFDRDVDAGEGDCAIYGCKSDSKMVRDLNRTVQMWRSNTRKRNGKIETMKDIDRIQMKDDYRRG